MNSLHDEKKGVYLAGAMERAPAGYGEKWREEVQKAIEDGWDEFVLNPYEQEPIALSEFGYSHPSEWNHLKTGTVEEKEEFDRIMTKIINYDLDLLEHNTFLVVCKWDRYAHMGGGTNAELTHAFRLGIPVITWVAEDLSDVPGWLVPCMGTKVFSRESLLAEIDNFFEKENV